MVESTVAGSVTKRNSHAILNFNRSVITVGNVVLRHPL
jgi:hypothetical protein